MGMWRFTRLTNAFSKKIDNHIAAIAIYFRHYDFCRVHQTLSVTPAMEAGIRNHVRSREELYNFIPGPKSAVSRIDKELILKALERVAN